MLPTAENCGAIANSHITESDHISLVFRLSSSFSDSNSFLPKRRSVFTAPCLGVQDEARTVTWEA